MKKPSVVSMPESSVADKVLREAAKAKLDDVLVIGVKDGAVCWTGFSLNSKGQLLFLVETFKLDLLTGELESPDGVTN